MASFRDRLTLIAAKATPPAPAPQQPIETQRSADRTAAAGSRASVQHTADRRAGTHPGRNLGTHLRRKTR